MEKAAKADRLTVAAYVEKLIVDDLEAKSFLLKELQARYQRTHSRITDVLK